MLNILYCPLLVNAKSATLWVCYSAKQESSLTLVEGSISKVILCFEKIRKKVEQKQSKKSTMNLDRTIARMNFEVETKLKGSQKEALTKVKELNKIQSVNWEAFKLNDRKPNCSSNCQCLMLIPLAMTLSRHTCPTLYGRHL